METILQLIITNTNQFTSFVSAAVKNEVATGLLIVGISGAVVYGLRALSTAIYSLLLKHYTTKVTVVKYNKVYDDLHKMLSKNMVNIRSFVLFQRFGGYSKENSQIVMGVGRGKHLSRVNGKFILVNHEYDKALRSEQLTITILGRSTTFLKELISEATTVDDKNAHLYLDVYDITTKEVAFSNKTLKRTFNNIALPFQTKDKIMSILNEWKNSEEWYIKHGIPFQLGIILYGPPGTGKTSIIKAIASHLNRSVIRVGSPTQLNFLKGGLSEVDSAIIVMEELDLQINAKRILPSDEHNKQDNEDSVFNIMDKMSLGSLLETLDGFKAIHGRVLIATTNNIDSLDSALIRPGRFDYIIEIGYMDNEMFNQLLQSFFERSLPDNYNIQAGVSAAYVQRDIISKMSYDELISKYRR